MKKAERRTAPTQRYPTGPRLAFSPLPSVANDLRGTGSHVMLGSAIHDTQRLCDEKRLARPLNALRACSRPRAS